MTIASRKLTASFLLLLVFVLACIRLGFWQWDRAAEFGKKVPDRPRIELSAIATPGKSLSSDAYGRLISVTGTYVKSWMVNERRVDGRTGPWQVALLHTSQGEILIVRGWADAMLPSREVRIEGRLYPAQTPETSADSGDLKRVDPALIVSESTAPLYDGYVIASNELPGQVIDRVPSPQPEKNPPGYYWQHISYVILWWFFGLLAIVVWARSAREEMKR